MAYLGTLAAYGEIGGSYAPARLVRRADNIVLGLERGRFVPQFDFMAVRVTNEGIRQAPNPPRDATVPQAAVTAAGQPASVLTGALSLYQVSPPPPPSKRHSEAIWRSID